jgi:5-methylcytosine-specific restriction endonuclease McrA
MSFLDDCDKKPKRTLGERDKKLLYLRANKKCDNCGKQLEYHEMQVGHRKAYSKGGSITLANALCLCYGCNNLQGTRSWSEFQKAQNKPTSNERNNKTTSVPSTKKTRPKSTKKPSPLEGPDWWLT